jgi:hypothetical protein
MRYMMIGLLAMTGCGHTAYSVSADATAGGVPFFPLESADVKKAVYEQTWIEVRVDGLFRKAGTGVAALAPPTPPGAPVDINGASDADLEKIPELKTLGPRIHANRPYTDLKDFAAKIGLAAGVLAKIESKLTVGAVVAPDSATDTFTRTVIGYTKDLQLSPADRDAAVKIYKDFNKETDDLAKSWSVTADVILVGGVLALTEPEALVGKALDARRPVAVERTRTQIPASKPLYFQIETPPGGSVIAALELAGNGTMTKGSSQVQDTLPGVITQTVGSVLSAALGSASLNTVASHFLAPAKPLAAVGSPTLLKVDLKLTTVRRFYTVTIVRPSSIAESQCGASVASLIDPSIAHTDSKCPDGALPANPGDCGICRATLAVEIQRDDDKPKDKPKDDPDAISVSGTIKLPKAAVGDGSKPKDDAKK